MYGTLFLLFWLAFVPVDAVKPYLFKKCSESGFCSRNRHFAEEIAKQGDEYQSRYSVDLESLKIDHDGGHLHATLLKMLNDGTFVPLDLHLTTLQDANLRVQVDEVHRSPPVTHVNPKRYNEAWKYALQSEPKAREFTHSVDSEKITLNYNDYVTEIQLHPFKITLLRNNQAQLVLNERNFFNLEHYRTREEQSRENSIHIAPEESTFDSYTDSFKDSRDDKLPFGPESVALDVSFLGAKAVYGIPEHADSLSLKDTSETEPYRLYNVDIFEYETQSKYPMYGSIPFMIGVGGESSAGVFWITGSDTNVDIKKSDSQVQTHWISESGILDIILITEDTPGQVLQSYGKLSGNSVLPNLFSLGYHQSRWNYNDEEDVLGVTAKFDESLIPFDAIWLDIEYTDDKKYFTWQKEAFPDPDRMMRKLDQTGRTLIVIIDPHLKVGYEISDTVIQKKIGILKSDGSDVYHGHSWPGESVWIDSMHPDAQLFWDEQFVNGSNLLGHSTNGHLWNDMNEPSVFNGPETSAPRDLIHYGDWEHRSVHNLWGLTYHEMTYESLIKRNPNLRPFILTRSFYAGSQRTSAMWTGDNSAKWEYLRESIPMVLTMNTVGFPFAGADLAGFFGNPDKDLQVRWYQTGLWYPFFRAHAHIDSRRHEPYVAGEPYTSYMRDAIKLRYKLLPLYYTLFQKNSVSGTPVVSPMAFEYPSDSEVLEMDNQFFVGPLLVKPVTSPDTDKVSIYIPDDKPYYDLQNYTVLQGKGYHDVDAPLDKIPVFIRGGSILITKERYRRSSKLMKNDPYTLYVAPSESAATGELYFDDGETFAYQDGEFVLTTFEFTGNKIVSTVKNSYDTSIIIEKIVVLSDKEVTKATVEQDGESWTAEIVPQDHSFVIRNPKPLVAKSWTITLH
ncbi:hypothetical protein OGAPHI_000994 [Ogataea philodendri]|uniref:Glucosidase II subunit alpha n=1 Tax=Ogataea philodendri TaxID=1378263 RepID=A0A9P8PFF4_9ASCO|nr:uncharacterized protein OGAPHI_000994 [Ogataea philodendri]KAH3670479.1 hypothetical protein OGAPHI_000994 [Ogataea philodendri]